jgi:predicted nucleic acid-binding protein
VAVEVDQLLRARLGAWPARAFLASLVDGEHTFVPMTASLLRRSVEIDDRFAELDLGLADATVMAIAEEGRLGILTFDFVHFRATTPTRGFWRLVVDEARFADAIGGD